MELLQGRLLLAHAAGGSTRRLRRQLQKAIDRMAKLHRQAEAKHAESLALKQRQRQALAALLADGP